MQSNCDEIIVSVCILTYNQELTIGQTIESVLNQSRQFKIEIVIGDDYSSDNTTWIIQEYKAKYPDLIFLTPSERNKGLVGNFLDTLALCRGKYIALCAGDDYWHNNNKLQLQVAFLEKNHEYGVVFSDYNKFNVAENILAESIIKNTGVKIFEGNVFLALLRDNFINAVCACFRHSILRDLENENLYLTHYQMEDYPLWLAFSLKSKIGYINDSLATYRYSEGSVSRPSEFNKRLQFYLSYYQVKKDYSEIGVSRGLLKRRLQKRILHESELYIFSFLLQNRKYRQALLFMKQSTAFSYLLIPRFLYHQTVKFFQ